MPVDLQTAFVPVGLVGVQPIGVAVNAALPVKTLPEMLELIKKTPGGMLFGATNRGGQSHLTGELLRDRTGVPLNFVHAQGAAASLNDVIAGRIPIMFEGLAGLAPGLQGGGVRLIAVASEKRLPNFPDTRDGRRDRTGLSVARLACPDGAGRNARPHRAEGECRSAHGVADSRGAAAVRGARHLCAHMSPAETGAFMRSEEKLWWPVVRQIQK